MIYRMKQNAVGLANICILSTMVLVVISMTVCMYAGLEDELKHSIRQSWKYCFMTRMDSRIPGHLTG